VSVRQELVLLEWVRHQVQGLVVQVQGTLALIVRVPKAQAQARIAAARLTVAACANKAYGY
jgi:hypothetical protein